MNAILWPSDVELTKLINLQKSFTKVAQILNCDPESVRLRARKRNLKVKVLKQNYSCNQDIFTNNNDISYYLLGAYISDGSVGKKDNRIGITSVDKGWLNNIKNIISPKARLSAGNDNAYVFRFSNSVIKEWLIKNECVPKKSLIVKFPDIPNKYMRDFIRGVFDGDGSISVKFYKNKSKYSRTDNKYCYEYMNAQIHSASINFVNGLSKTFNKLKLKHFISSEINKTATMKNGRKIKSKNRIYRIVFSSRNALAFLKWLYYKEDLFCLNRKRLKAKKIFSYYEDAAKL